jgi:hypothetical protein
MALPDPGLARSFRTAVGIRTGCAGELGDGKVTQLIV